MHTYSAAGRMVQAQSLTATLVYTYNADGLRVAQSQSVASVQSVDLFSWDWATGVPELLSDGESLYLIGYDTLGWQKGDDWTFVLPDALGSVRQETDAAGAVTAVREWSPYGEELGGAQTGLGFTGEWWDDAVGLQYLRARWLDVGTGRFTQVDPWEGDKRQALTLNPYLYVVANPLNAVDPSGNIVKVTYNSTLGYYVVELNVQIYGRGASSELATEWEEHLDERWNGGDPQYEGCPVIFDINFVAEEPVRSLFCQIVDFFIPGILYPKKAEYPNVIYVEEGHHGEDHPFMRPYYDIERSFDWGFWYSEMGNDLAFHESSHLMGIYENAPRGSDVTPDEAEYADWISGDLNGDSVDHPASGEIELIIKNAIEREQYKVVY